MSKIGLVLALVLAMASMAFAYSFLEMAVGSQVFPGSARCLGMGEVGVLCEQSPQAAGLNPALLGKLKGWEASGSYRFVSFEDKWSLPTYDSFDALLGYTCYSRNSNLYNGLSGGVATGPLENLKGVSLGVSFAEVYDFTYDFHEEVRDRSTTSVPSDKPIADALVDATGSIYSLAFGLGKQFTHDIGVGVGLEYLFGDFDITSRLSNIDVTKMSCWDDTTTRTHDDFKASKLKGTRLRVGATYRVNKRLDVGFVAVGKTEIKGDYNATSLGGLLYYLPRRASEGDIKLTYPSSFRLGFTFRPRNELLTVVELNACFTNWSDAGNSALSGLNLEDTYEFNVGVEHVFYSGRPVRFGFFYRQSPLDSETSEAAVTAGSGFMVGSFKVEFAGKVGWRDYRYFDLFDDSIFCARSRDFTDKVEETSLSGLVTISRRF